MEKRESIFENDRISALEEVCKNQQEAIEKLYSIVMTLEENKIDIEKQLRSMKATVNWLDSSRE